MQTNNYRYRRQQSERENGVFPIALLNELIANSCFDLDNNPNKLTIHADHVHIFDTVHVETCEETCVVDEIAATVTLNHNGIDNGCNPEQCRM